MPIQEDNPVPEDVLGGLEALALGLGPFEDAEFERLKENEEAVIEDTEEDRESELVEMQARIAALEQALIEGLPSVDEPKLLPDQNIEHGKVVDAFSSGTTMTIDPVDVNGNDTGEDNLVVYVRADRSNSTVPIADNAEVTWARFDTREDDGTAGVLVGGTGSTAEDTNTDTLVSATYGQAADELDQVLVIKAGDISLLLAVNGAQYDLSHKQTTLGAAGSSGSCGSGGCIDYIAWDATNHLTGVNYTAPSS